MEPYDVCVVFGDEETETHQVWAATEREAIDSILLLYKDSTVTGVIFQ